MDIRLIGGKTYSCSEDQTIFDSARLHGIVLEHSCLNARCSACKIKVLSGKTKSILDESVLSDQEREEGFVLSCNSIPITDLEIEAEDLTPYDLQKPKTVPAKISSIEIISRDVMKLSLRVPPRQKIKYQEGQYVDIIKGSLRRSYSIANASREDGSLDFLIKNYPNGKMSNYLFNEAKENDLLRVEGPHGTFFLRDKKVENLLFLAIGTGIAPIKAILEKMKHRPIENIKETEVYVIWGVREEHDIYTIDILNSDWINFKKVITRPEGKKLTVKKYVQDIAGDLIHTFARTEVYACGSNIMIESARKLLVSKGLPESNFYADAFVPSN